MLEVITRLAMLLALVWGVVFDLAFIWTSARRSALAQTVYAAGLATLYGLRVAAAGGALGPLGSVLDAALWFVVLVANVPALWLAADYWLATIGGALTGDSEIKVRKSYDRAEGVEARHDYATAATLYRVAINEDPRDIEARRRLAEVLLKAEDPRAAAEQLRAAFKDASGEQRAAIAFRLAEVFQDELHRTGPATQLYMTIIRDHADSHYAPYAQGRLRGVDSSPGESGQVKAHGHED